jgi:hypothetical protein
VSFRHVNESGPAAVVGPPETAIDLAPPPVANAKDFAPPVVEGRHIYLRPVTPGDYGWMQKADSAGDLSIRWRFRGATPSPEQWLQSIWGGTLAQFLVVERRGDQPKGVVALYRVNFQHGHGALAAARLTDETSPVMVLGIALFLRYVFTCWNLRKLYMEVPEFNYPQMASGLGRLFEVEGKLRDHTFYDGQYWDELVLAVYRDAWLERGRWLTAVA